MIGLQIVFAWGWVLLGLLSGVGMGLFFHREDWLGGYESWRRRLIRLGHIAFFGTGLLNLMFALTARSLTLTDDAARFPAGLLIAGAATMPTICFLAAWRKPMRNLFFVPVICLVLGAAAAIVAVTPAG